MHIAQNCKYASRLQKQLNVTHVKRIYIKCRIGPAESLGSTGNKTANVLASYNKSECFYTYTYTQGAENASLFKQHSQLAPLTQN